ncbi:MAG TPA: glycosyltransferase [Polyangia bacterium]|nr:glycosyltransferase [Polyangia bacterium]
MRVVDISSFFSDTCGGIKTYYRHKARFLPELGVDCHFVVPGPWGGPGEEEFGGGVLHRIAGPALPGHGAYRIFGRVDRLIALLQRLDPDVIEFGSHTFLPWIVRRALAADGGRGSKRPALVGFFHSNFPGTVVEPFARRLLPPPVARAAGRAAWRWVRHRYERYDATLVASHEIEALLRAHGIPRVTRVGLGVDVDVFRPRPPAFRERPTLVYAGRLAADKGFDVLARAFPAITGATGARLRIIGDGPNRADARRLAAAHASAVSVEGYLDRSERVAGALAAADAVLVPGPFETFSLITAEAMACATPVIAANRGGARELVEASGGGVAFAAGNPDALARVVIKLLARPVAQRRQMGASGRAHVIGNLTWRAVMGRIHDVYRNLIDGAAGVGVDSAVDEQVFRLAS